MTALSWQATLRPDPADWLRAALRSPARHEPVCAVGAANAIAATVANECGFEALWVSGLEVSANLALPDRNVVTVRDMTDVVASLRRASTLPIVVDVDNADGSTASARRWGADLVTAGAAAVCLEDSAYPKANSFQTDTERSLGAVELVCRQISCMRDVGEDLVVIARTESLVNGSGLASALARARAYAEAGADAVLIHSKDTTGQEALAIATAWDHDCPLVSIPTAFPQLAWADLGDVGYRLCIYANHLTRAALAGMRAATEEFVLEGTFGHAPSAPLATVSDVLHIADPAALASI